MLDRGVCGNIEAKVDEAERSKLEGGVVAVVAEANKEENALATC